MKTSGNFGIWLALIGVLILTPDTMLMRWSGLSGWDMLVWRGFLMGLMLLVCWALTSTTRSRDFGLLSTIAGVGVGICQIFNSAFFAVGIAIAPVAIVLFGVATVPIWAAIFGYLLAGERTGRATWITTAIVMVGIAIAVFGGDGGGIEMSLSVGLGALCGLAVAASLAFSFVIFRKHPDLPIMLVIGLGAIGSGCIGLAIGGGASGSVFDGQIWAIAISGAILLPVSFVMMSVAARYTAATNVSLLLLLETIIGPVWVWFGTGEAVTLPMIIGGGIVVISLAAYIRHTARTEAQ